ncbi:hypothetical protein Golomagni_03957 [Golovinomyces magnicellulatus]|nr:hypothetical protein Golomagni_03957 [Golovinomyces magnicellulatus]
MTDAEIEETGPTEPQSRNIIYCGDHLLTKACHSLVCHLPPEVLADQTRKDALSAATSSLSVDAQKRAEKDAQKKALKAEAAEAKQAALIASSRVLIKRVERSKRKFVTIVAGLEAFSLENKKVAKDFGKKFATGSSVTKTPSGGEEIVVQGDLSEEIEEFILEKYPVIPGDNIELIEDMKKKSGGSGVGGG